MQETLRKGSSLLHLCEVGVQQIWLSFEEEAKGKEESHGDISNDNDSIDKGFGNSYFMALKNQELSSISLYSYSFDEL